MKKRLLKNSKLMFVSPWLLAGAIGLLTIIIVILAANNIQREQKLMTDSLFRKGQALIRFIGAGMRTSMMSSMLGGLRIEVEFAQIQNLIEQASDDPEILYLAIVDTSGKILAHSDPDQVGEVIDRDLNALISEGPDSKYHIINQPTKNQKAFEVAGLFDAMHRRGRGFQRRWIRPQFPDFDSITSGGRRFILVGLDITELENAVKQYRYQILFLSLVLLLVGLGGWISLLAVQSYRMSDQALNRVQAFTGLLISRLPVGIIATDQEGKIKTFNQAAAKMIGKSIKDTVINRMPEQVLPASVAEFFKQSGDTLQQKEVSDYELTLPSEEGNSFSLLLSSVPVLNPEKIFMGQVLLMHDLSELKKLEKKIRRHDRLVALGKMAAGVAHEVRNPLSSIKGLATLLGSKFSDGSEEKETTHFLVDEVERLNRSITELLNYARPAPLQRQSVSISDLLHSSVKLIRSDIHALDISLSLDVPSDLPEIKVDPDRMNQVLLNLYLNGLQALEKVQKGDGLLKISAAFDSSNGNVIIKVEDNGIGIPNDLQEQILDPYFTTKPEGTGLGLAIANKIIEEHGGTINFVSSPGKGTEVLVSLPIS